MLDNSCCLDFYPRVFNYQFIKKKRLALKHIQAEATAVTFKQFLIHHKVEWTEDPKINIDTSVVYRFFSKYVKNSSSELQSQTDCLTHWKSPLFSSFWYVSRANSMSEMDINKPLVWYVAWAKADHTNCLSLFTGDNSSWYFQPDNSWQDKSCFHWNWLQRGTRNDPTPTRARSEGAFWFLSFWLTFQDMTDSHLPSSSSKCSHLVKVAVTFLSRVMAVRSTRGWHLWLENSFSSQTGQSRPRQQLLVLSVTFSGRIRMRAYSWPSPRVPECHSDTRRFHESAGRQAQGSIWQVLRHPYLVHKWSWK